MVEAQTVHNVDCKEEGHGQHLCFLMYDGFHYSQPADYKAMVRDAEFRCQNCARTAHKAEHVCAPVPL